MDTAKYLKYIYSRKERTLVEYLNSGHLGHNREVGENSDRKSKEVVIYRSSKAVRKSTCEWGEETIRGRELYIGVVSAQN